MESSADDVGREQVDAWLVPLDDTPSGPDLEYDIDVLTLSQLVAGKPETQFSAAEPPNWVEIAPLAEQVMGRTRDLRIAMPWLRAQLNVHGLAALPQGLRLLIGLLSDFWETVHPQLDPEDQDDSARLSALAALASMSEVLGDVRQALLVQDRRMGNLRVRDVEIALGRLNARDGEESHTRGQIEGLLSEQPEMLEQLRDRSRRSREGVLELHRQMVERLGHERAVDLKALRQMVEAVIEILPGAEAPASEEGAAPSAAGDASVPASTRASGDPAAINSRQDAVRALDRICAYLDAHEPTNPAQLLLRRAQRLIDKDFLQLVQEFAPDALEVVARAVGVDPNTLMREE